MARKSISRSTAEALGPIVVPLVTRIALPIVIESLRRGGRFDGEKFYEEAKEGLSKGAKKSRPELEDLKEQLTDRGSEIYSGIRKQGADLLESLAEKGSAFAEEWMGKPRQRRRLRLGRAMVIAAAIGAIGYLLANRR